MFTAELIRRKRDGGELRSAYVLGDGPVEPRSAVTELLR